MYCTLDKKVGGLALIMTKIRTGCKSSAHTGDLAMARRF